MNQLPPTATFFYEIKKKIIYDPTPSNCYLHLCFIKLYFFFFLKRLYMTHSGKPVLLNMEFSERKLSPDPQCDVQLLQC